jgi:hypothetical protein
LDGCPTAELIIYAAGEDEFSVEAASLGGLCVKEF